MKFSLWGSGEGVLFGVEYVSSSKDIPPCTTRIVRSGKGMPWDDRIAIHPLPDGRVEVIDLKNPTRRLEESDAG